MIRRRLLKLFCVFALGLALYDVAIDTVFCESGETVECRACLCCTHVAPSVDLEIERVEPKPVFAVPASSLYVRLVPTGVFRPPRLAA